LEIQNKLFFGFSVLSRSKLWKNSNWSWMTVINRNVIKLGCFRNWKILYLIA